MSKIEEIRKRAEWTTAGAEVGPYSRLARQDDPEFRMDRRAAIDAIADRLDLLAALDGEWQSERPEPGRWYVSCAPDIRGGADPVVEVDVFNSGLVFARRSGKGEPLDHPMFTGALWKRRTVPADPFKGGKR